MAKHPPLLETAGAASGGGSGGGGEGGRGAGGGGGGEGGGGERERGGQVSGSRSKAGGGRLVSGNLGPQTLTRTLRLVERGGERGGGSAPGGQLKEKHATRPTSTGRRADNI